MMPIADDADRFLCVVTAVAQAVCGSGDQLSALEVFPGLIR